MKKHKLLLSFLILITFFGGFFAGILFSNNNKQVELAEEKSETSKKPGHQRGNPEWIEREEKEKVLIGYVQDFRDPNTMDYSDLTHIIFSFAHPTKDGQLLMNGDSALNHLRTTVEIAHNQGSKIMLAVGGWFHIQGGESYEYFKDAISQPASRTNLVNNLVDMVVRENLDGIDIDFEHPRTNEDAQNLAAFTKELSEMLHPEGKELSIAVNAKVHSVAGTEIKQVVYEPTMFNFVDHVNIMAYDGQWDGEYNAANLSPYSHNKNIVTYWSHLFDKHEISREKLVLGVPFYAQPEDPNSKQISYNTIINQHPENSAKDIVHINGITYHYNGEETVQKKTKLALDHGFGGMMVWEIGHDSKQDRLITAISHAIEYDSRYTIKQDG
ncbi:glycosyl hydrolase family 18 protein [Niallia sp. Krafla_26]|uniref:glycosyl hydrolase family 18 protein n=1 Tax=Niallia sp. Krafla_26 TaxID=3064703 RepID=UPI003D16E1A0